MTLGPHNTLSPIRTPPWPDDTKQPVAKPEWWPIDSGPPADLIFVKELIVTPDPSWRFGDSSTSARGLTFDLDFKK